MNPPPCWPACLAPWLRLEGANLHSSSQISLLLGISTKLWSQVSLQCTWLLNHLRRWQPGPEGPHRRADNALQADQWSYNILVPAGAIYTAQVSLLEGKVAMPFSGTLSLLLNTRASVTVPIQSTYTGTNYAPAMSR